MTGSRYAVSLEHQAKQSRAIKRMVAKLSQLRGAMEQCRWHMAQGELAEADRVLHEALEASYGH